MMKTWNSYTFKVNGFEIKADYTSETVEQVFVPLLQKLSAMQEEENRRIIVLLSAPPAVGKSTLAEFLSYLSGTRSDLTELQAVGMDGFHFHNEYLNSHSIERDGQLISLKSIKGAPETFDIDHLTNKILSMKEGNILFPYYDRTIHDVREDAITIEKSIILIEGNYLLLDEEKWKELKQYADYSIRISASPELLHERLVTRKMMGGTSREDAEDFYQNSDRRNVERVLKHSISGDLNLKMTEDNDYIVDSLTDII